MEHKLILTKSLRGEDSHRIFSVRIDTDTLNAIERIAGDSGLSRNMAIVSMLRFAVRHPEFFGFKTE